MDRKRMWTSSNVINRNLMASTAMKNMEESIQMIPDVDKKDYLEALKTAPHLVETESDPMRFLQADQLNYRAAAVRLTFYWQARKKTFGDRTFLPLTLYGESALSLEVIGHVRHGVIQLLPNDSAGRSVVFCDQSKYRNLPPKVRFQILFYATFILMRNPLSQMEGVVYLFSIGNFDFNEDIDELAIIAKKSMPVRWHSFHGIYNSGVVGEGNGNFGLWSNRLLTPGRVYAHPYKQTEEISNLLLPFGITKDRLPKCLGGSWELVQWDGLPYNEIDTDSIQSSHQTNKVEEETCALYPQADNINILKPEAEREDILRSNPKMCSVDRFIDFYRSQDLVKEQEENPRKQKRITVSGSDVLLGKGRIHSSHAGNLRFQYFIESHSDRYDELSLKLKYTRGQEGRWIVQDIMQQLRQTVYTLVCETGRFLKCDPEDTDFQNWYEVKREEALEKISMAFRNQRKRKGGFNVLRLPLR